MTEATAGNRGVRVGLLALGGVTWVAVFVVLYWKWKSWRETVADPPDNNPVPVNVSVFQPYELPDFSLIDQNRKTVTKSDLSGKPWVASFLFNRCSTHCPRVAAELEKLQKSLGDMPVRIVTITVDPEHDNPDVLKRWADSLNADADRWKFLTGEPKRVYDLLQKGFKIVAVPNAGENRTPGNEVAHSQSVMLVDESGTVIGKYDGASAVDLNRLRRDLRSAVKNMQEKKSTENSASKTGSRNDG